MTTNTFKRKSVIVGVPASSSNSVTDALFRVIDESDVFQQRSNTTDDDGAIVMHFDNRHEPTYEYEVRIVVSKKNKTDSLSSSEQVKVSATVSNDINDDEFNIPDDYQHKDDSQFLDSPDNNLHINDSQPHDSNASAIFPCVLTSNSILII